MDRKIKRVKPELRAIDCAHDAPLKAATPSADGRVVYGICRRCGTYVTLPAGPPPAGPPPAGPSIAVRSTAGPGAGES